MSDGPLPESTRGVDSSPEAIAAVMQQLYSAADGHTPIGMVERDAISLRAAALLAQVGRERDEAQVGLARVADLIEPHWRGAGQPLSADWLINEIVSIGKLLDNEQARADAAERQLAEARAALNALIEPALEVLRISDRKHDAWDKAHAAIAKARALLSGETT